MAAHCHMAQAQKLSTPTINNHHQRASQHHSDSLQSLKTIKLNDLSSVKTLIIQYYIYTYKTFL